MQVTSIAGRGPTDAHRPGLLSRARIVAPPGYNRWLVPPAALMMHLCIGMVYGLSVFWLPLSHALAHGGNLACSRLGVLPALTTTTCDWRVSDLVVVFSIGIVVLGVSAALFGGWLERAGPRKAGVVAAMCWGGGFLIGALGIRLHQLWLVWLGIGLVGGLGLGLGYISPVSTLIKWFPDRRGMATGMAIMGFGGGAMIGSPLATLLINHYKGPAGVGVWQTLVVMGLGYLLFMLAGAFSYRVPPAGWRPDGWVPTAATSTMIAASHVALRDAHKTRQFWLLWLMLCLNVSAGIGVLALASPMFQEIFAGSLIGRPHAALSTLDAAARNRVAVIAAGFVGLLSLFNILGRFFWASISDRIGRKLTYAMLFAIGLVLYAAAPWAAGLGSRALFVLFFCIILSMYGGGFATIPAYLADIFGTQFVGAIHGRLLTAWSTAGIVGPLIVTQIRQLQLAAGVQGAALYGRTLYVLAGFLAAGLLANLAVRPLASRWFVASPDRTGTMPAAIVEERTGSFGIGRGGLDADAVIAWTIVGLPILWGVWITLSKALIIVE